MEHLTSRQNVLVKYIRSLAQRKVRERERCFVVEGVRLLEEALQTMEKGGPFSLETVIVSGELRQNERELRLIKALQTAGVKLCSVSAEIMEGLADTVNPQGVLGVVRRTQLKPGLSTEDPAKSFAPGSPLILIMDRIQDPGNLGTLLRTAEAAGVTAVWLLKGTVDPFSPKVLRATMGSIFRVPIATEVEACAVRELRNQGVCLLAAGVEATALPYYEANFCKPLALVLGNEANGLADWLKLACDQLVTIPLAGAAESLNAAVAGAVILFEARRQRQAK